MTSDDLLRGYWLKRRTLVITAVPNHHDSKRFGQFLSVHTDLGAYFHFSPLTHNGEI